MAVSGPECGLESAAARPTVWNPNGRVQIPEFSILPISSLDLLSFLSVSRRHHVISVIQLKDNES
jgi:hypothetical protein